MAKERLLTPEQRDRYDRILKNKGKEAADAYKAKIAGGSGESDTGHSPRPKRDRLSDDGKQLLKDVKDSKKVMDKAGLNEGFDTISSPELDALLDPNSPSFVGLPSKEEVGALDSLKTSLGSMENPDGSIKLDSVTQSGLDRLKTAIQEAGITSPEVAGLIDRFRADYEAAGALTPRMQDALDAAKKNVEEAGKEDPRYQNALNVLQEGMLGISGPQAQALREKSMRETEGRLQQAQQQLADSLARNRVTGGASLAASNNLKRASFEAQQQAEQDLLLKDFDMKKGAAESYGSLVKDINAETKTSKNQAMGVYGDLLSNAEKNAQDAKTAAGTLYGNAVMDNDKTIKTTKASLEGQLANATVTAGTSTQENILKAKQAIAQLIQSGDIGRAERLANAIGMKIDLSKFNEGQEAGKSAATISLMTGQKSLDIADKTADATLNVSKGSGGGSESSSSPSTSGVEQRLKDIEDFLASQKGA